MDAIVGRWKDCSISEEDEELDVQEGSLAKGNSRLPFELVGRVITKKPVNKRCLPGEGGFETLGTWIRTPFIFSFQLETTDTDPIESLGTSTNL
ncbi:hypothetical protein TorRG33x02_170800 [Trema orientale]|uniref:Uncharacterized protein n=1 Tax=Trema orientale TaxID=63057 RepID=A0A2P5ENH7_TREOI|nr:hypothetical protein TorRG33x02_170800 [Trema orientale]